mgnify:CR=1 FL=1
MGITIFLYKKKSKFKLHKLLLYLLSLLILFFKYPSKFQKLLPYFHSYKIESSNILSDDILLNEIRNVNKLIPLEVELSETLTIDNTYFNLDIFKKSKKQLFLQTALTLLIFLIYLNPILKLIIRLKKFI